MRKTARITSGVVAVALASVVPLRAAEAELSNKIAVIIDGSGSYRARQGKALERSVALLDGIATQRVNRWDRASDQITIISLDAMPDVLWEGSVRELKTMDRHGWTARFAKRSDFASCTDVTAAFRLAVQHLEGDPRYVSKFIFAFTDLIHEPPTTSLRRCQPAGQPSLPSRDFPWNELKGVSVTVLWTPPEQTLAWRRAVAEHGLESTFVVHTDSESGAIKIAPPPRPVHIATEAERAVNREQVATWGRRILIVLAALVALIIGLSVMAARASRRHNQRVQPGSSRVPARRADSAGHVATNNVRPLPRPSRPN